MRQIGSRIIVLGIGTVALSFLAGWMSTSPSTGESVTENSTLRVQTSDVSTSSTSPLPTPLASSRGERRISPNLKLSDRDREFIKLNPAEAARSAVDATREGKRKDCKRKLPHASDEYCERILQVDGRTGVKFIDVRQRFLTGEIDQATYQSEMHKTFLEHEIALENFMPARDFAAHEEIPPGSDIFLTVMGGFTDMPPGYKLGDEIFDQPASPPTETTDSPPDQPGQSEVGK